MAEIYYGDRIGTGQVIAYCDRLGGITINLSNSLDIVILAVLTMKEAGQLSKMIHVSVDESIKMMET